VPEIDEERAVARLDLVEESRDVACDLEKPLAGGVD
jgi:hypothetical protein